MRLQTAIVLTTASMIQFMPRTFAHHSFAGEFDTSTAVTWHGVVMSVEMINPHSFIYLDVKTSNGVERWALEGPGPTQVRRRGLELTLIKPGDEPVTADGKSVMQMIVLEAVQGTTLRIEADGEDAAEAVKKLAELFESKFGED